MIRMLEERAYGEGMLGASGADSEIDSHVRALFVLPRGWTHQLKRAKDHKPENILL
jgi:hypothetical protein